MTDLLDGLAGFAVSFNDPDNPRVVAFRPEMSRAECVEALRECGVRDYTIAEFERVAALSKDRHDVRAEDGTGRWRARKPHERAKLSSAWVHRGASLIPPG